MENEFCKKISNFYLFLSITNMIKENQYLIKEIFSNHLILFININHNVKKYEVVYYSLI